MTNLQSILVCVTAGFAVVGFVMAGLALIALGQPDPRFAAIRGDLDELKGKVKEWSDKLKPHLDARLKSLEGWTAEAKRMSDEFVARLNENVHKQNENFAQQADHIRAIERLLDEWDRLEVRAIPMPGGPDDPLVTYTVCTDRTMVRHALPVETLPATADREAAIDEWIKRWGREPVKYAATGFGWFLDGWIAAKGFKDNELPGLVYQLLAGMTYGDSRRRIYDSAADAIADLRQALGQLHAAGIPFPDCH